MFFTQKHEWVNSIIGDKINNEFINKCFCAFSEYTWFSDEIKKNMINRKKQFNDFYETFMKILTVKSSRLFWRKRSTPFDGSSAHKKKIYVFFSRTSILKVSFA